MMNLPRLLLVDDDVELIAGDDLAWSTCIGATFKLGPQEINDVDLPYVDLYAPKWGLPGGQSIGSSSFTATELSFAIRAIF
jgi:hypothetical protein